MRPGSSESESREATYSPIRPAPRPRSPTRPNGRLGRPKREYSESAKAPSVSSCTTRLAAALPSLRLAYRTDQREGGANAVVDGVKDEAGIGHQDLSRHGWQAPGRKIAVDHHACPQRGSSATGRHGR